jgi:hypothetical protein
MSHADELISDKVRAETNVWLGEMKKSLSEIYTARQGMLDLMRDVVELKARVFGVGVGWGKPGV